MKFVAILITSNEIIDNVESDTIYDAEIHFANKKKIDLLDWKKIYKVKFKK